MKKLLLALILMLTVTAGYAQQADYSKLSPWVRQMVAKGAKGSARALAQGGQKGERCITAFVQTDGKEGDELLTAYGCRKLAHKDDICIASIPVSQIGRLSRHPAIRRIEASQRACTLMDTTTTVVNALPVYEQTSRHQAYTGKGVVMGLMDVGFDLTNPNFYTDSTPDGYRIGAFWDQLSKDTVGSVLPVGRDFIGRDAILAQGCSIDGKTQSHGTHTLGIAAGSGYGSPYRGMAFESDICLVSNAVSSDIEYIDSADYDKFTTAVDALGFKYIFDYADQLGKPCVASFSEGYTPWLDEEDSLYSAFLDKLIGPGRILVVAAGNESQYETYAEKPRGTDEGGAFIRVYRRDALYRIKADGPVTIRLRCYESGFNPPHTLSYASSDERMDSLLTDTLFTSSDTCVVNLLRYPSKFSKDTLFVVSLLANRPLSQLPHIALTVEGRDSHAEIYGNSRNLLTSQSDDPRWDAAVIGHNILGPACFPAAICVGSTSHRLGYVNYLGEYIDNSANREKGKHTPASSMGPSMNGLTKPDVCAPGENIISSYSSFYIEANPDAYDIPFGVEQYEYEGRTYAWTAFSGTSMACPVVAGTIALWLQAVPTLTREDIIGVFSRTCRKPDETLTYPNNVYGHGEIDAYRGLLDILGIDKIEGISLHQPQTVQISAEKGLLHLLFATLPTSPVTVSLYTTTGALMFRQQLLPSATELTLPLPALATGIYAVQLSAGDKRMTGSQLVRL